MQRRQAARGSKAEFTSSRQAKARLLLKSPKTVVDTEGPCENEPIDAIGFIISMYCLVIAGADITEASEPPAPLSQAGPGPLAAPAC